jgi:tRNA (cmo5U34)-methyltransferase
MGQFHFTPDDYLELMHAEVPRYEELQHETATATSPVAARTILELGTGTGETARRVLARHPGAHLTGIDESERMLSAADLPGADLRVQRLEDELPAGPFDLVVSALAVHHLDGPGKQDLFSRVARVLQPDGLFVLGDVVVPPAGQEGPIYIDWEMDKPDSVEDQLAWLGDAGFEAEASSVRIDLAVFRARLIAP